MVISLKFIGTRMELVRVKPDRVEVLEGGRGTRLVLKAADANHVFHIRLPVNVGQRINLELNGLAVDMCGDHHVGPMVAKACGRDFSSLVLTLSSSDMATAHIVLSALPLLGNEGDLKVPVSLPSSLAMAIHLSLPIYINHVTETPDGLDGMGKEGAGGGTQIPPVFRDAINGMDWPDLP